MKKILLLFFSAVLSFLAFSYVDEYESLILPLFSNDKAAYTDLFNPTGEEERIGGFLVNFNSMLSAAYLSSDPSKVSMLPLSDELKKEIIWEITFLKNNNKTMDMQLRGLSIVNIIRPSPVTIQVKVVEKVGIRTLSRNAGTYSESENNVTYLLTVGADGLTVSSFEITFKGDHG